MKRVKWFTATLAVLLLILSCPLPSSQAHDDTTKPMIELTQEEDRKSTRLNSSHT